MKRLLVLAGFPALMGLIWLTSRTSAPSASAIVRIDSNEVIELRGTVISRLQAVGAVKTSETTKYTGGGESQLTFKIPPARIEDALAELNAVGGTITEQHVELDDVADTTRGITVGLESVQGCLSGLAQEVTQRSVDAADLSECRARVDVVSQDLENTSTPVADAVVTVELRRPSTRSPILIVAVILLAGALLAMAFMTFRSSQGDDLIDLSDFEHPTPHDELYTRRN